METGDVIKLGRVEYLVLECNNNNIHENEQSRIFNTFCEVNLKELIKYIIIYYLC